MPCTCANWVVKGFTVWKLCRYYLNVLLIREFYGHRWHFVISVWQVVWWQSVRSITAVEGMMNWQSGHSKKKTRAQSHAYERKCSCSWRNVCMATLNGLGWDHPRNACGSFVVLNSHTSTNGWGTLICVRTIRKKCALLEWSAVNTPLHGKATFFFEQLRSIVRFIPECANTTSYCTSVKLTSLPNSGTLSWPGLRAELYIYI